MISSFKNYVPFCLGLPVFPVPWVLKTAFQILTSLALLKFLLFGAAWAARQGRAWLSGQADRALNMVLLRADPKHQQQNTDKSLLPKEISPETSRSKAEWKKNIIKARLSLECFLAKSGILLIVVYVQGAFIARKNLFGFCVVTRGW